MWPLNSVRTACALKMVRGDEQLYAAVYATRRYHALHLRSPG
jgi:hypothetical protein